ncbi:MAG: hypothetical protein NTV98_02265 [Candidatus Roizmanbacteria bacterium]|nr:hypothetical protein [Candidatus Roizmanbacteria bacterium]
MRSVIDRTKLSGTSLLLFNTLFPPQKKIGLFNEGHISQDARAEYSPTEKRIVNEVRTAFGFAKSGEEHTGEHDMPDYRLYYKQDRSTFAHHLNELEVVKKMKNITVTSPLPEILRGEHPPKKMNRADHSKIIANAIFRDIMRMAVKTPELFIERVHKDISYFEKMGIPNAAEILTAHHSTFTQAIMDRVMGKVELSGALSEALPIAIEYAKYLMLFAYLHDSKTPADSDLFMKAKARFPGQSSIKYSEDAQLGKDIENMTDRYQGSQQGIFPLFERFQFDRNFFVKMTQSYCSENDPTLGASLIKGKRKDGFVEKGGPKELKDMAVFDEDQVVGSTYNFLQIAEQLLPGGVVHMYQTKKDVHQIGSFYERFQLMAYAFAAGINKEQLMEQLVAAGLPHRELKNLCISPEEFQHGPNFTLVRTPFEGEILPVSLEPRPLKRILQAFAFLTLFKYQGDVQAPVERLFQDIVCSIHDHQLKNPPSYTMHADSQMTEIARAFVGLNDLEAEDRLANSIPTLNILFPRFLNKTHRMTEQQLEEYIIHNEGLEENKKKLLISRDTAGVNVSRKEGTLVLDTLNGQYAAAPYLPIVSARPVRIPDTYPAVYTREENPDSFPHLLTQAENIWKEQPIFHVIELNQDDVVALQQTLQNTEDPYSRIVVERTLRYWMVDMNLHHYDEDGHRQDGVRMWENPLKQEFILQSHIGERADINAFIGANEALIQRVQASESSRS